MIPQVRRQELAEALLIAESIIGGLAEEEIVNCPTCYGGGWECYGIGIADPHFRECPECHNPKGYPSP